MPTLNTLCKRIIPCLDVAHGRTVKGVKFQGSRDVGDPAALALAYQEQGADEIVFLDISASPEGRGILLETVRQVARVLMIPFTVGGGITTLEDVKRLLGAGADKISVNSAAVKKPGLITEIADAFGSQCCVLAIDAKQKVNCTGWEVLTHGGRCRTDWDALAWGHEAVERGAGEILLTSWDKDGTLTGYDLNLTRAFADALPVPVIASGGANGPGSFIEVFREGRADAALAASIFHDGKWSVGALKKILAQEGIMIRP